LLSACTIFNLVFMKIGCASANENKFSFALGLHYLCTL
jgi:hypothetical protein